MSEGRAEINDPSQDISRNAAEITLGRLKSYDQLNAPTVEDADKKFKELTRDFWKGFAVHGTWGKDRETGRKMILPYTDLDGKSCLGLLRLAGIDTRDVKYVAAGDHLKGRINLDTGGREGVVIEDGGLTAFFDHHAEISKRGSSAAQITYEALSSLGLLKKEPHLDRLIHFVSGLDNHQYPFSEESFRNSYRTVLGLARFINFRDLVNYFQEDRRPEELLSEEELRKMGLEKRSRQQRQSIGQSWRELEKMETNGLIIPSERYGQIAVDIGKKVSLGTEAAKSFGCGMYIIWSPEDKSFYISSVKPITDKFSQGIRIRETMWLKPRGESEPLKITLRELLEKLTDGKIQPAGALKEFLDEEREAVVPTEVAKKIPETEKKNWYQRLWQKIRKIFSKNH